MFSRENYEIFKNTLLTEHHEIFKNTTKRLLP